MTPPARPEVDAHFPADPSSAGAARRLLAATLAGWQLQHLEEAACLLVSELVSNVLLHAGTELDVHVRRSEGRVRVEVHDGSPRMPERRFYSTTSATGRGLVFLAELASAWGVEPTPTGKAVWFELEEAVAPAALAPSPGAELSWEDWEEPDDLPAAAGGDRRRADEGASGRRGSSLQAEAHAVAVW